MSSIYLHIPFCRNKCSYCSFNSYAGFDSLHPRYLRALIGEIAAGPDLAGPLDTLFVGGGTPTVLNFEDLTELLETCREKYGFAANAEVSIEANPESVGNQVLHVLRKAGFNRLSIGVQSLQDRELSALGRVHDSGTAQQAIIDARRAGFDNLSIDLMYGVPDQTPKSWGESLQKILALGPRHLSAYQLSIEADTEFMRMSREGGLGLPKEDSVLEMEDITRETCSEHGLQHYEISNFARPTHRCRHNEVYWSGGSYFAAGPGAARHLNGRRETNHRSTTTYMRRVLAGMSPVAETETLSPEERARERLIFQLRMLEGVNKHDFTRDTGFNVDELAGEPLSEFAQLGLIEIVGDHIRLTRDGLMISDALWPELL